MCCAVCSDWEQHLRRAYVIDNLFSSLYVNIHLSACILCSYSHLPTTPSWRNLALKQTDIDCLRSTGRRRVFYKSSSGSYFQNWCIFLLPVSNRSTLSLSSESCMSSFKLPLFVLLTSWFVHIIIFCKLLLLLIILWRARRRPDVAW
jgi:hypothetical protein